MGAIHNRTRGLLGVVLVQRKSEEDMYENGKLKLHCCDCMELMRQYPDKHFDLAIVDPPYGLPKDSTNGRGKLKTRILNRGGVSDWDVAPPKEYFDELFRVSKNQIIWGGNYFGLPPSREVICWDKCQPWENFSQWEMAWTSFNGPARIFRYDNRTGEKIHPTQKPVALYKWLLSRYAKEGFKVLDTHLGSGSIAIACHDYGCELIGSEINEGYYNNMVKRVRFHQLQQNLFE